VSEPTTVATYLAAQPPAQRRALRQIRHAIKRAAPDLTERISYRIPTFDLAGRYVLYMAAFTAHVSIYPVTTAMQAAGGARLAPFRSGPGTLRFRIDEPLPLDLIAELAAARVAEVKSAPPRRSAVRRSAASGRSRKPKQ
jgi:uncharacterized protein YdhG (YjbR/CyaY superfamily)